MEKIRKGNKINRKLGFAIIFLLVSCATHKETIQDQNYIYDLNGNYYKVKIVDGLITDTSFVFSESGKLLEKSTWIVSDSSNRKRFQQMNLLKSNDSTQNKSDSGERTTESILKTIRKQTPSLRHIYNKYLRIFPRLNGRLYFRFWINPSGKIDRLLILENTTKQKEFAIETARQISSWVFEPKTKQGEDVLTIPFTFSE